MLSQVQAGSDPQLCRKGLDEHGHQIAGYDDPEQCVAKLGASLDVGGEVAGIHIGHAGDESWPQEWQQARQTAFPALAGQDLEGAVPRVQVSWFWIVFDRT